MRSERPAVVFVLAHPDDEFACSMWLKSLRASGRRVAVTYLTDGGFGGQATDRREQESLRVLRRLGVEAADVVFLGRLHGWPDGALHACLAEASAGLKDWVNTLGPVGTIVMPAWEGGHQDHDAAHLAAIAAASHHGISDLWQIPLYTGAGLPGPFFRVLHTLVENGPVETYRASWRERLQAIALCVEYASQWKTWLGLLPFLTLHLVMAGTFPRQRVQLQRVRQPPHAGAPLYERRGFLAYRDFRASADRFICLNPGFHDSGT